MIERPSTVRGALAATWVLSAAAGVVTLLVWIMRDDLVLAWAEGNRSARAILREGGIEAVEANLEVPGFVPVVVTSYVVLLMLVAVFAVFFAGGFRWGQIGLAAVALFGAFLAVLCIASGIPVLFEVLSGVMIALCLGLLVLLLHPRTLGWLREV
ncbi:hypothetical protein [Nocardioides yefusunii]|uniref:Uncharacterized protein n=1 Tax=Nocardioides yefusunii TaxID=2500546 RepID=A0ABW1QWU6_9ACTN|nr:hypothetical protein [Nocardioides yefusunii]